MKRGLLFLVFALLLTACGSTEQAQNEAPAATEAAMTWQDYYDLGVRYLSDGNYEEAIIAFAAAIEIDPKQASAYVSRGDAYVLSGESEENLSAAQADYEKAIELDDTNAQAYLGLADIYIRRGDYDTALEILQDALNKTDNDQSIADKIAEMESDSISDSSGNVRRENYYNNDTFGGYLLYNYDAQNRKLNVTSFNGSGNQTGYGDYLYDGNGNLIQGYSRAWNNNNIELVKILYEYDENGNNVKETWYWNSGYENYYLRSYDDCGNEIRADRYSADGTLAGYALFSYNLDGSMAGYIEYSPSGELLIRYVFRYDDEGNYLGLDAYRANGDIYESTDISE